MKTKNLLLLHGALGTEEQLLKLKEKLSDQCDVHSFTFEGHGKKLSGNGFSIELFTQNILEFLSEKNITRTNIFGYSMGGYAALNFAFQFPEMVENIVTYGTKFNWNKETAAKEVKMLDAETIEKKVPKFAAHLQSVHEPSDWKAVLSKTAQMMLELGDQPTLTPALLSNIQHQVLVGVGDQDNMVTIEESQFAVDQLTNGNLKVLEGFHHPIEQNNLTELAQVIHEHLKTSDSIVIR